MNQDFNTNNLDKVLKTYKKSFNIWFPEEVYKWKAVKTYKENWDINNESILDMITRAFSDTGNLLMSNMYFPFGMIKGFAEKEPETTRTMFNNLFDESIELTMVQESQLHIHKYIGNEYNQLYTTTFHKIKEILQY